jgi:hypothetical protein
MTTKLLANSIGIAGAESLGPRLPGPRPRRWLFFEVEVEGQRNRAAPVRLLDDDREECRHLGEAISCEGSVCRGVDGRGLGWTRAPLRPLRGSGHGHPWSGTAGSRMPSVRRSR